MGQARRRRQQLDRRYGTPAGSNGFRAKARGFQADAGSDQEDADQKTLREIQAALAAGEQVTLIGTDEARPLAEAAGLPWLHEIPAGESIPRSLAWNPDVTEAGGPKLPPGHGVDGFLVIRPRSMPPPL